MFRKALVVMACSTMLGAVGCSHSKGSSATPATMPDTTMPATTMPATTMPTTAATGKQSMMDQAKAMFKKGEAMFAKGKMDGNTDEQNQGSSMMDQAKTLLAKAKGMM